MQINLNNKEIFYKLLPLYKSSIFKFIKFNFPNNNDKNIELLISGLNIKNRKRRITYVYDLACKQIDDKTKGIDICGFKDNQCFTQRKQNSNKCNGCCRLCKYQTPKGCTTKNLSCKLFNCAEVTTRYDVLKFEDLPILKLLSWKNKIIVKSDYFSTREDILKDLYSYSLIYSTIRVAYRFIKNYLYVRQKITK